MSPKLSIIIPCFNEENTIGLVISEVKKNVSPEDQIIVVDDCSTDLSFKKIQQLSKKFGLSVIQHKQNLGKGAAVKTALKATTGEIIIIQDADLELNPEEYSKLIKPILFNEADVVYGSRYLSKIESTGQSFLSFAANIFLTKLTNILTGLNLTDVETCYKAFKASDAKKIDIKEKRFGFEIEITCKFSKLGLELKEVPLSTFKARKRLDGKKISWMDGVKSIYCIFRYAFFD